MAKKKKVKAGRLPKDVLGVKVPKDLRKAGERLIEQAQGPAGRQAIAGALTAVVGAVASAALSREAAKAAAARAADPARAPGADAARPTDPGEAFARAAEALVGKFLAPRS
jgi:hypothetical protein